MPCSWPEIARAFDAMGNADSALAYFEKYADSVLQPRVTEIRERISQLRARVG